MRRSLYFGSAGLFTAFTLAMAPAALANVVDPGTTVTPDVFTSIAGTEVTSTSGSFTSVDGAGDFSGTFTEYVYRGNSYGPNDLTWYIQVMNDGSSGRALEAISASDFTGFATDVGFVSGTGAVAPTFVSRGPSGGPINFLFPSPDSVDPGGHHRLPDHRD
jgi:hypothetical protein